MKFYIWSEGDHSTGIPSQSATVEIEHLEECGEDVIKATIENLELAFEIIFDDIHVYVVESTETGVIDR